MKYITICVKIVVVLDVIIPFSKCKEILDKSEQDGIQQMSLALHVYIQWSKLQNKGAQVSACQQEIVKNISLMFVIIYL